MIDFNRFIEHLKEELTMIASGLGEDLKESLIRDGIDFAGKTQHDLINWSEQLESGELTKDDILWLLEAKKDLAEMQALKQKGLAKARIDQIKNSLIQAITGSIVKTIVKQ